MTGPPPDVAARLRAAGCVFAGEEAALLAAATVVVGTRPAHRAG